MLSIKVIKAGSEGYYLDLAAEDYYFNGGEPPGRWVGGACKFFGLAGTVDREDFKRLFNGFHPRKTTGPPDAPEPEPLVQNAGDKNRRAGFDMTFSAPKSFSILWSQAAPEMQEEFQEMHHESVAESLNFAEQKMAHARTGKAGSGEMVPVGIVAAVFEHGTSRAQQPLIHSHAVLMNVTVDADGKTRSLEPKAIFKNKMLLGAMYRGRLAHKEHKKYGFKAKRNGNSFEFEGVSEEHIQHYSVRSQEIRASMKKDGRSGAIAAAQAAVTTRKKKKHVARHDLFAKWRKENEQFGFNDKTLKALVRPTAVNYARFIPKILKEAVENLKLRLTHFTAHDFLREVLYIAPEYGVSPDDLLQPVQDFLRTSDQIIPILMADGSHRLVATTVLEQELKMLRTLRDLHDRRGSCVDDEHLTKALEKNTHLNDEQRAAVRHITQNNHAIRVVQGYAGTGKTTMLRTAVQAWHAAGYNVVGACFMGVAADNLAEEIGIPCDTIHMTLADLEGGAFDTVRRRGTHALRQLARAALNKKTYGYKKLKRPHIDKNSIVLLDEAGMINTRHMLMLMEWVEKNNATLVLTGDRAQIPAIEGGSPMSSICERVGYAELKEIRRQEDEWARAAALHLARGEVAEALALYDKRNLVKVNDDTDEALERLIVDWADHVWDRPANARIITLTNNRTHQANQLAQQELIKRKKLDNRHHRVIEHVNKKSGKSYQSFVHVGDRVIFTRSHRKLNFRNGSAGTVLAFTRIGKTLRPGIRVKLDNEKVVSVPLSFRHIRLGYASTVNKVQGGTYPEVFVLLGGAAQNLPISYVQGTRSQKATHFYTTHALYDQCQDIEDSWLVDQMERRVELSLAVDLFVPPSGLAENRDELLVRLLADWKTRTAAGSERSLVITKDDADAQRINDECHRIRYAMAQTDWEKRRGQQQQSLQHEQAMPTFSRHDKTFVVGDRLRIKEQSLASGLIMDELATVTRITPDSIELKLDRKEKPVSLAMDKVPQFDLGYAMKFEQAVKVPNILQDAFLFQPDKFCRDELRQEHSTGIDYFMWQPTPVQPTTIYSPSVTYAPIDYPQFKPPENTWTYMTAQQTQMAAAYHHQTYQANQQACWQAHQFQHTTQIQIDQSYSWKHGI